MSEIPLPQDVKPREARNSFNVELLGGEVVTECHLWFSNSVHGISGPSRGTIQQKEASAFDQILPFEARVFNGRFVNYVNTGSKMAKRLALFNHKGGVSKTTTVYNVGWMLAKNHRVLLVDADPQCNLTSLILRDSFDDFYINPATKNHNIKDGVAPAFSGKPSPITAVTCYTPARQQNLCLLAGHATLSEYDASLTFAQTSNALATLQNLPGAFNELIRKVEDEYSIDYTVIDLNPGLSAINQNLFLASDFFLIPTNPDPFSIMALETLKSIFPRWAAWKTANIDAFAESAYPLRNGVPKFAGTIVQRFNVRNGRAAAPYRDNISEIKDVTVNVLMPALTSAGMILPPQTYPDQLKQDRYCIDEIPDFGALLPKSYEAGVPVFALRDNELGASGVVLDGMVDKRNQIHDQFSYVADTLGLMMNA